MTRIARLDGMGRTTMSLALSAALLLAACGGNDEPEPEGESTEAEATGAETTGPETTAPETTEPETTDPEETDEADEPDEGPEWTMPGSRLEQSVEGDPDRATGAIVDVRTGAHDGFDRVVLDLDGEDPEVGWFGELRDEAPDFVTGDPIPIPGTSVLHVPVYNLTWLDDRERYEQERTPGEGTVNVTEVYFGVLNEGQQEIFIGLEEPAPFRVFRLDDPARVVIDVRHP